MYSNVRPRSAPSTTAITSPFDRVAVWSLLWSDDTGASCQPIRLSATASPTATAVLSPEGETAALAATAITSELIAETDFASMVTVSALIWLSSMLASAAP